MDIKKIQNDILYFLKGYDKRMDFLVSWFPKKHDGTMPAEFDFLFIVQGKCSFIRIETPYDKAALADQPKFEVAKNAYDARVPMAGCEVKTFTNDIDIISYMKEKLEAAV